MITPFNLMGRTHALWWQSSDRKLPQDKLSLQTLTIMRYEPFRGPTAHTQIHNRAKHSKKHHFQVLPDRYGPKKPHESLRFFSTIFRTYHAHNLRSYNCSTFNYAQSYATYPTHQIILTPIYNTKFIKCHFSRARKSKWEEFSIHYFFQLFHLMLERTWLETNWVDIVRSKVRYICRLSYVPFFLPSCPIQNGLQGLHLGRTRQFSSKAIPLTRCRRRH